MNIIACIISVIFLFISLIFNKKKKSISPSVLFFALWSFILFLSIFNLYKIKKPSDEAYFLIILMLIFFFLGNCIDILIKKRRNNNSEEKEINNSKVKIEPRIKIFYIVAVIIILFNLIDLAIIIKESSAGTPMWQIRNWSLQPYGSSNPILDRRSFLEDALRSIVLAPFITIIYPITAYYFFNSENKKHKIISLILSVLVLISSSLAGGGGRLGFIYFVGCFLIAFFVASKNEKIPKEMVKKYKKILILILTFGIVFVVGYTTIRTGADKLFKQVYTYFALPPTLLSEWLPEIKNVEHTYGMTTFFGLHSYFFRVLDTVGLDFLVPQIYDNAFLNITNAEIFKNVGYGVGNAFVTPIYYFFLDGGYPFVCVASLFFGYIVSALYQRFEKRTDARSVTLYIMMMYGIFLTFARIQTVIPGYIISFIFAIFILKRSKKNENKNNEIGDKNYEKRE